MGTGRGVWRSGHTTCHPPHSSHVHHSVNIIIPKTRMKEGGNSLGADNHCGMTDLLKVATVRLCECSWHARDHKPEDIFLF